MILAAKVLSNVDRALEEPLRSIQIVLPLLLVFASSTVLADQVAFKNGDRLTGAILKSDAKSLLMTTAVGGK